MIPLKLSMENFISHVHSVLDFTQFDVALLVGTHSGNPDISNGVGKSAIFDAMRWALYGKSRFTTKNKVVKRGKASCKVIFEFKVAKDIYKIQRRTNRKSGVTDVIFYKKFKDKWESDGLTCDTATMTNRKIIEIINMNDDTFVNSNYFRQNDISGFADASTSKRKEILKEVLQIGIWDDFQKAAKSAEKNLSSESEVLEERIKFIGDIDQKKAENDKKMEVIKKAISDLRGNIASVENILREKKEIVSRFEMIMASKSSVSAKKIRDEIVRVSTKTKELRARKDELHAEIKLHNERIVNADADCVALEKEILALLEHVLLVSCPTRNEAVDLFLKMSKKAVPDSRFGQTFLDENVAKRGAHIKNLNQLHQDLTNLRLLEPGKECPTCLLEVRNPKNVTIRRKTKENFLKNRIEEEKALIKELDSLIDEERHAIQKAYTSMVEIERKGLIISKRMSVKEDEIRRNEGIQRELVDLSEKWKLLKEKKESTMALMAHSKNNKAEQQLTEAIVDRNNTILKVDGIRKQMVELSVELGHLEGYSEELERRVSERQVIVAQRDKVVAIADVYSNLSKAFGKDGIQAIIMENVTEDLRKYTNSILKKICSDPMTIDFITQKQTASGAWKENFDITITVGSAVLDFGDLSGGEQVRVSIAIRLALSQLLMRRVGSNVKFLLLDEVDQALDQQGIESLSDTIHSLSKDLKILVITHSEPMKEKFENIITVQKGPAGSVLKQ
jgi:DNA repair exonuclease SbcCD ATPase subunit